MGWANCGWNATHNVFMGYANTGTCMHPGCDTEIDHGLYYVCGDMHEGGEHGCGKYLCPEHLEYGEVDDGNGNPVSVQVCPDCFTKLPDLRCTVCGETLPEPGMCRDCRIEKEEQDRRE